MNQRRASSKYLSQQQYRHLTTAHDVRDGAADDQVADPGVAAGAHDDQIDGFALSEIDDDRVGGSPHGADESQRSGLARLRRSRSIQRVELQQHGADAQVELAVASEAGHATLAKPAAIGRAQIAQHQATVDQHLELGVPARHRGLVDADRAVGAAADAVATGFEAPRA